MSNEQTKIFAKGFNSFLERTEQSKTEIAKKLGITPQVTSGWSRGISEPSFETCQKLLNLDKPMRISEMFGEIVSTVQILELATKFNIIVDLFEEIIVDYGKDFSIKDFKNGEYDYRKLIQDFVEILIYLRDFPQQDRLEKFLKKLKTRPNINKAIQSEINLWKSEK